MLPASGLIDDSVEDLHRAGMLLRLLKILAFLSFHSIHSNGIHLLSVIMASPRVRRCPLQCLNSSSAGQHPAAQ